MTISQLQRLRQASTDDGRALPTPREAGKPGFSNALEDAINKVDDAQKASTAQMEAFVSGEQENLHEVMISMNEARLSFQLMTEVRNRMLETYQELMRMQV